MRQITLRGTYSEMGAELGTLLRKSDYRPPPVAKDRFELARGCEQAVEEHAPDLLEELNAVVEAGKYGKTSLKAFELSLAPFPEFACSIFAVSSEHTSTGKLIFARNYDWDRSAQDIFTLFRTYPKGALASMSFSDLLVGRYGGINEAGLAIGLTAIPGSRKDYPGVMLHLVARWVLDNCRTVKEAINFIENIPHVRGNNYIVADLQGDMALVQASPQRVEVVGSVGGLVAATNHFQTPSMQKFEIDSYIPELSITRLDFIRNWFKEQRGKIDSAEAQRVLRGPIATREGVSQDFKFNGGRFSTIWAWTYEAGGRTLEVADGPPFEVDFEEYDF